MALDLCTFEIRPTGSRFNSGGFNPSRGGVDYSQQDAAQLSLSDVTQDDIAPGETTSPYTLRSPSGGFTPEMVGNTIRLHDNAIGDYNASVWRLHEIVSYVDANTVLINWDGNGPGLNGVSQPWHATVGGACSNPCWIDWNLLGTTGTVYIKRGEYDIPENGWVNTIRNQYWLGYNGTRGDDPTGDNRPLLRIHRQHTLWNTYDLVEYDFRHLRLVLYDPSGWIATSAQVRWLLDGTFINVSLTPSEYVGDPIIPTLNPAATGDLGLASLLLSGVGAFFSDDVTGRGDEGIASGGPTVPAIRLDGAGEFQATVVTAAGGLTMAPVALAGSGQFAAGPVTASGSLTLGPIALAGIGTRRVPAVVSTAASLLLGPMALAGNGLFQSPVRTATGGLDIAAISLSGTGSYAPQAVSTVTATAFSNAPNLLTYRDVIEHLIDFFDGLTQESDQKRARGAIQAAYRDVAYMRKWRYLQTHYRLQLAPPYQTGTVTYDASNRQLTLSGGTWPVWARSGHLRLDGVDVVFKVAERSSASVLVLDPLFSPTASVTAASGYTLFRSTYDLPGDLWAMEDIHDENNIWSAGYMLTEEWMASERRFKNTGRPFQWTVTGSADSYGQLMLCLYGYPSRAESLDFLYTRRPRLLRLDGYELFSSETSGREARGASGTGYEVTFDDDFVYEAAMAGSVLRLGRPGGTATPKGFGQRDQWWQQKVIVDAGTTGNQVRVDSPVTGGFGKQFVISDPVDLPEYLFEAFLTGCEYQMLKKTDAIKAQRHYQMFLNDLRLGAARDAVTPFPKVAWGQSMRDTAAWRLLTGSITPSGG